MTGSKSTDRSKGFSLTELLVAVAIILTISAITVPNLLRARAHADEVAVTTNMRSVASAETLYQISYAGYADSLEKLGAPAAGAPVGPDGADLLGGGLACRKQPCINNGYAFFILGDRSQYSLTATPMAPGARLAFRFNSNDVQVAGLEIAQLPVSDQH